MQLRTRLKIEGQRVVEKVREAKKGDWQLTEKESFYGHIKTKRADQGLRWGFTHGSQGGIIEV